MDPLIDRNVLFGNPERTQARISPDGRWISFLAPFEGVLNVWSAPADDVAAAKPITNDVGRGIQMHSWAWSSDRILYLQDLNGDENWHIFSVDPSARTVTDLTPIDGVMATWLGSSPRRPHHIVVGLNDRNAQLHDPTLVDIRTGERTTLLENPGFLAWTLDRDLNVRLGIQMTAEGSLVVCKITGDGFEPWFEVPPEDSLTTGPIGFNDDGLLYLLDSRERNTSVLKSADPDSNLFTVLAEDARADIHDIGCCPITGRVQYAVSTYAERQFQLIDDALQADLDVLHAYKSGDPEVVCRTADDQTWMVAWEVDGGHHYALYNRGQAPMALFSSRPNLGAEPLAERRAVIVPTRDGLEMVCYLTVPRWCGAKTENPLPMVLLVHGGPWARDQPGFSPIHQLLANRGYAVLSVNYRGSTGFGKDFVNASNYEWAGKMHDDLLDAVDWAVDQGVADRSKVAIIGGSYGGYATLVGLTFTPEVFACGVDIVGPSNILTLIESFPEYWKPALAIYELRVGSNATEEGRAALWKISPLSQVDAIVRPLLIGQGANDPRVTQIESDQIVTAMRARKIPVTYALFPDEGHGFQRPENKLAFYGLTEKFLAEHLGGRFQDGDTDGTSMEIR
ncbi:MAG: alpha/beta fold hydrolase [Rhodobacterales bacterium]|nr:alpha/beta fold hydrolase [Rhodobacterales bacterium]